MTLSNAARARMLARLLSKLMEHQGLTDFRIPIKDLDNAREFGLVVDGTTLIVALGDKS